MWQIKNLQSWTLCSLFLGPASTLAPAFWISWRLLREFLWHLKIANYSFPGLAWTVQQQSPKYQTGSSGIWTQDHLHPKWKGKSFLRHFPGHSRGVLAGRGGVRCWGCSCCPPAKPRWLLSNLPTAKRSSFNYMFLRLSQISFRLIFRWSLLILN